MTFSKILILIIIKINQLEHHRTVYIIRYDLDLVVKQDQSKSLITNVVVTKSAIKIRHRNRRRDDSGENIRDEKDQYLVMCITRTIID